MTPVAATTGMHSEPVEGALHVHAPADTGRRGRISLDDEIRCWFPNLLDAD
jgi:hypothetical protein